MHQLMQPKKKDFVRNQTYDLLKDFIFGVPIKMHLFSQSRLLSLPPFSNRVTKKASASPVLCVLCPVPPPDGGEGGTG